MAIRTRTPRVVLVGVVALLLAQVALPAPASPGEAAPRARSAAVKSSRTPHPAEREFEAAKLLLAAQKALRRIDQHMDARRDEEAAVLLDQARGQLAGARALTRDTRVHKSLDEVAKQAERRAGLLEDRRAGALADLPPGAALVGPPPPKGEVPPAEITAGGDLPLPDDDENDPSYSLPALDDRSIPLESHPMVDKWVDYFTGRGRPTFERWLERSGRYMDSMKAILEQEGVPTDLVHVVFVESGFNPQARSVASAVGPWQFIRGTANLFGLKVNSWVDQRKDHEASTVAAARYLKHLHGLFNSWPLALASYNAGEGTVLRAIKRQGTTNYWDLKLPRQTEEYVPQFMAVLAISRDPEKYGFDAVELDDPMEFDQIAFKGPVDLRVIAKLCETPYEEMRLLNPAVIGSAMTGANGVTVLRVPEGKGPLLLEKLQKGAELPAVNLTVRHKVRRGESLSGIAAQYHVSAQSLARVNGIGKKRPLVKGMTLSVPASLKPSAPVPIDDKDPTASTAYVPSRVRATPASLNASSEAEGRVTHVVKRGETLSAIAAQYGVTSADLRRWNRLSTSTVGRGTRLKVRTGDAAEVNLERAASDSAKVAALKPPSPRKGTRASGAGSRTVVVRSGDTLGTIATRHGVSLSALKRANGISGSTIRTGQRLRLPA